MLGKVLRFFGRTLAFPVQPIRLRGGACGHLRDVFSSSLGLITRRSVGSDAFFSSVRADRFFTYNRIYRSPDCAIDSKREILRVSCCPLRFTYQIKKSWRFCGGLINFGPGAFWMSNVTAWCAAKLLPDGKYR